MLQPKVNDVLTGHQLVQSINGKLVVSTLLSEVKGNVTVNDDWENLDDFLKENPEAEVLYNLDDVNKD